MSVFDYFAGFVLKWSALSFLKTITRKNIFVLAKRGNPEKIIVSYKNSQKVLSPEIYSILSFVKTNTGKNIFVLVRKG